MCVGWGWDGVSFVWAVFVQSVAELFPPPLFKILLPLKLLIVLVTFVVYVLFVYDNVFVISFVLVCFFLITERGMYA